MSRLLITGASGEVGRILTARLDERHDLTLACRSRLDHPGWHRLDLAHDPAGCRELCAGQDAIIHLAYVEEDVDCTANVAMAKHVLQAALKSEPHPRVVIASSIHATGGWHDWSREPLAAVAAGAEPPPELVLDEDRPRWPNGLYGAFKGYLELLARHYADLGLCTPVLRIGAVREDDHDTGEPGYRSFWLSGRDCAQAFERAATAPGIPAHGVYFVVSANRLRVHSIEKARRELGYAPADGFK